MASRRRRYLPKPLQVLPQQPGEGLRADDVAVVAMVGNLAGVVEEVLQRLAVGVAELVPFELLLHIPFDRDQVVGRSVVLLHAFVHIK
jgi:hypothetical protein